MKHPNIVSLALIIILAAGTAVLTGFHAPVPAAIRMDIDAKSLPCTAEKLRALITTEPGNIDAHRKLALRLYRSGDREAPIKKSRLAS